jgi:hypothetical protein
MGELKSIRLCAALRRDPSGELGRARFSSGTGISDPDRFRALTLRGCGGEGGGSGATVMDDAMYSSLSFGDLQPREGMADGDSGESLLLLAARLLRPDRRSDKLVSSTSSYFLSGPGEVCDTLTKRFLAAWTSCAISFPVYEGFLSRDSDFLNSTRRSSSVAAGSFATCSTTRARSSRRLMAQILGGDSGTISQGQTPIAR